MVTRVRMAQQRDAVALAEMNRVFNGPSVAPSRIRANLRRASELVAVAVVDDNPVGFVCAQVHDSFCYHAPYAEITEVFVKSTARRGGVATRMIGFMEHRLARRDVVHLHILTGSRNRPARSLYEKLGYRNNRKKPEILYEKDMAARRKASHLAARATGRTRR